MKVFNLDLLIGGLKIPKTLHNMPSKIRKKTLHENDTEQSYQAEPFGFFETHHSLSKKTRSKLSREGISFRKGLRVLKKYTNTVKEKADKRYEHNVSIDSDYEVDDLSFDEEDLR